MDFGGPAQVFSQANDLGCRYEVRYFAESSPVDSYQGVPVHASKEWPDLDVHDIVLVAGWKISVERHPLSPETLRRIADHGSRGGHLASVCAGSILLADAGVLDQRRATTHHELLEVLARRRTVQVERDVLFTCAEGIHTSAGIASGIDLSLHLVAHDHGSGMAARVARSMVVPAMRPGDASQSSVMLKYRNHMDDMVHRAQDLLDDERTGPTNLKTLASCLDVSDRTLVRHFRAATGMTPHAYHHAVRRERAEQMTASGATREEAARAAGFADARSLRRRKGGETGR